MIRACESPACSGAESSCSRVGYDAAKIRPRRCFGERRSADGAKKETPVRDAGVSSGEVFVEKL